MSATAAVAAQDQDAGEEQTRADRADHKPEIPAAAARQKIAERCASRPRRHDGQPVPGLRHFAVLVGNEPNDDQDSDEHDRSEA